jgi:hypothetical protein
MNTPANGNGQASPEVAIPRWVRDGVPVEGAPTAQERAVLEEVLRALRRVRHGSIQLVLQDGRVVQLETTEKRRF